MVAKKGAPIAVAREGATHLFLSLETAFEELCERAEMQEKRIVGRH